MQRILATKPISTLPSFVSTSTMKFRPPHSQWMVISQSSSKKAWRSWRAGNRCRQSGRGFQFLGFLFLPSPPGGGSTADLGEGGLRGTVWNRRGRGLVRARRLLEVGIECLTECRHLRESPPWASRSYCPVLLLYLLRQFRVRQNAPTAGIYALDPS